MSLSLDVFVVDPKPVPSAVPGFEEAVGPATWPPSALERSSTPAGLIDRMTAAYPNLANPYTLWVAAYDLLGR